MSRELHTLCECLRSLLMAGQPIASPRLVAFDLTALIQGELWRDGARMRGLLLQLHALLGWRVVCHICHLCAHRGLCVLCWHAGDCLPAEPAGGHHGQDGARGCVEPHERRGQRQGRVHGECRSRCAWKQSLVVGCAWVGGWCVYLPPSPASATMLDKPCCRSRVLCVCLCSLPAHVPLWVPCRRPA